MSHWSVARQVVSSAAHPPNFILDFVTGHPETVSTLGRTARRSMFDVKGRHRIAAAAACARFRDRDDPTRASASTSRLRSTREPLARRAALGSTARTSRARRRTGCRNGAVDERAERARMTLRSRRRVAHRRCVRLPRECTASRANHHAGGVVWFAPRGRSAPASRGALNAGNPRGQTL